jgi:hypothetical protein
MVAALIDSHRLADDSTKAGLSTSLHLGDAQILDR